MVTDGFNRYQLAEKNSRTRTKNPSKHASE